MEPFVRVPRGALEVAVVTSDAGAIATTEPSIDVDLERKKSEEFFRQELGEKNDPTAEPPGELKLSTMENPAEGGTPGKETHGLDSPKTVFF